MPLSGRLGRPRLPRRFCASLSRLSGGRGGPVGGFVSGDDGDGNGLMEEREGLLEWEGVNETAVRLLDKLLCLRTWLPH